VRWDCSPIGIAQAPRGRSGWDCSPIGIAQAPRVRSGCDQAPRVLTWFLFDSNNNFLKFINDDNSNANNNF